MPDSDNERSRTQSESTTTTPLTASEGKTATCGRRRTASTRDSSTNYLQLIRPSSPQSSSYDVPPSNKCITNGSLNSSRGAIVPFNYDVPTRTTSPMAFSTFGRTPSPPPVQYASLRHGRDGPDSGPASMVEGAAAITAAEQARMIPPPLLPPPEEDEGRGSGRSAGSAPALTRPVSPRQRTLMGTFSLRKSPTESDYKMPPQVTPNEEEGSYQNVRNSEGLKVALMRETHV